MAYCPNCGNEIQGETSPEQEALREAVEIERIRADKEIAIARLQARMQREELDTVETVTETQAEAEIISSVAEAEIIGAAVENSDSEPEGEPIILDAPEEVADETPDVPAPEPADSDGEPDVKPRKRNAWWG